MVLKTLTFSQINFQILLLSNLIVDSTMWFDCSDNATSETYTK